MSEFSSLSHLLDSTATQTSENGMYQEPAVPGSDFPCCQTGKVTKGQAHAYWCDEPVVGWVDFT